MKHIKGINEFFYWSITPDWADDDLDLTEELYREIYNLEKKYENDFLPDTYAIIDEIYNVITLKNIDEWVNDGTGSKIKKRELYNDLMNIMKYYKNKVYFKDYTGELIKPKGLFGVSMVIADYLDNIHPRQKV